MLDKINLISKDILLTANNETLSRFSEEDGDNYFTFGAMEYTSRNNYIRKLCAIEKNDNVIKIISDNNNTVFKYQIYGKNVYILGKNKSKKFLSKLKKINSNKINNNLFKIFRDHQISDIFFSILKDNENRILEIYRTDKNIYGEILNHLKIYDVVQMSNSIDEYYIKDIGQEEEELKISIK